jgi:hypothetical protein
MMKRSTIAQLKTRDGSALVWAMVVVVVLLILIGVMATVAQAAFRSQKSSQIETQAYYTALSVNESIINWLSGTKNSEGETDQQQFIAKLKKNPLKPVEQTYTADDLDPSGEGKMGTAAAIISINDDKDVITIKTTGRFANDEETIVSTLGVAAGMANGNPPLPENFTFNKTAPTGDSLAEVTSFTAVKLESYLATETALNAKPRDDNPVIVGNESLGTEEEMTGYNNNTTDQNTVASIINDYYSNRELTWRNRDDDQNTTLGTTRYPNLFEGSEDNDKYDARRLVTPSNGKWTLNPLQAGGYATTDGNSSYSTSENNTRLISLSMGDFNHKDLEIRLGGYNTGSGENELKNGSDYDYYNSLLMFDFTDNAGYTLQNPFIEYYGNNTFNGGVAESGGSSDERGPLNLWHPQQWGSMTIYTQNTPKDSYPEGNDTTVNDGVNKRLVFGPYAHKYDTHIDYWNWGRYKGNPWYGQTAGDMNRAFPDNNKTSSNAESRWGMAYMPEYYGGDFHMYFLDQNSGQNVLILQGVNILGTEYEPSSVYSRRGVEIGGGLIKSDSSYSYYYSDGLGQTNRHVNSTVDGMSYGSSSEGYPNYFGITTRYSQIFYNTDIVLQKSSAQYAYPAPVSTIFDATLPDDGNYEYSNDFSDTENKKYSPTVRIIGGDIYVGEDHRLNIDGGRVNDKATAGAVDFDGRAVTLGTDEGEYTQVVAPDSITVASKGALYLRGQYYHNYDEYSTDYLITPSAYANVDTDIYVSGTMTMEEGSKAKGGIYVDKSATVWMGREYSSYDGYGDSTEYEGDINVAAGGTLNARYLTEIKGDIVVNGDTANGARGTVSLQGSETEGDIIVKDGGIVDAKENSKHTGTVNIITSGSFSLDNAEIEGDIYVSGKLSVKEGGARTKGNLIMEPGGVIETAAYGSSFYTFKHEGDVYITSGASLTLYKNTEITGDIYIHKGGELKINGESWDAPTIVTGDVYCVGKLEFLNSDGFTLNPPADSTDDGVHGVIIYNNPSNGLVGTLSLPMYGSTITRGKVHAIAGYPLNIMYFDNDDLFCDDRDPDTNACQHWLDATNPSIWEQQGDSVRE